ncbi:hypothetical protein A3B45_00085 [Candidatus Daviesbacteria bacterium RIFCSPLOWO2_01_FULL_39_12]|uniref:FAD linked oxidase N-terminal domain-containing protein n=1 Tax=Candidatus Daviesbacteria bacterium RIFCSPLOWO2_01_FULL_39_12 TaxID=1797785 RepID=A0A1F5KP80_9BACT|nr:MAG: hypothetical protein A3B45_00085 [Candidatus Daviesbacteria bacterium RIFCSPLOWO2_01_FULL_39_12]
MDNKYKLIVDTFGKERFKFDEILKDYTSLEVGGPAKLFFIAFSVSELRKIIEMCRQLKLPFFIFGTGSKMMISDLGFNGLVVKNRTKNLEVISIKGKATRIGLGIEEALIEVDSGVSLTKFREFLKEQNLLSDQFLNMTGSVGGNLFTSIVLQSLCKSIKVLSSDDQVLEIAPDKLRLKQHIILSAVFRIKAI